MNFAGRDRQWPRPVDHVNRRRQVVVGPQVFVKLAAMRLLDDQNAFDAFKGGCHLLRPGRRQQARRDDAGVESFRGRASDRFARSARERSPGCLLYTS